eukprot:scaffold113074_cov57-Phaeocystis_antarctica.AAC.1
MDMPSQHAPLRAPQDAVARAMVGVVTAGARRAALDDDDESGAAAATVACLLGMAGAPWLTLTLTQP